MELPSVRLLNLPLSVRNLFENMDVLCTHYNGVIEWTQSDHAYGIIEAKTLKTVFLYARDPSCSNIFVLSY